MDFEQKAKQQKDINLNFGPSLTNVLQLQDLFTYYKRHSQSSQAEGQSMHTGVLCVSQSFSTITCNLQDNQNKMQCLKCNLIP